MCILCVVLKSFSKFCFLFFSINLILFVARRETNQKSRIVIREFKFFNKLRTRNKNSFKLFLKFVHLVYVYIFNIACFKKLYYVFPIYFSIIVQSFIRIPFFHINRNVFLDNFSHFIFYIFHFFDCERLFGSLFRINGASDIVLNHNIHVRIKRFYRIIINH